MPRSSGRPEKPLLLLGSGGFFFLQQCVGANEQGHAIGRLFDFVTAVFLNFLPGEKESKEQIVPQKEIGNIGGQKRKVPFFDLLFHEGRKMYPPGDEDTERKTAKSKDTTCCNEVSPPWQFLTIFV